MSFLKELQLQHGVLQVPHVSLEEINISLEGLSLSKIKELVVKGIKKIKDFFIKIFKWIKEKVLTFLKSKRTKEIIEKSLFISKFKQIKFKVSVEDKSSKDITLDKEIYDSLYTDEEIRNSIIEFFRGREHGYFILFNYNNFTLIDFKNLINLINNYISDSIDYVMNIIEGSDITDETWDKLKGFNDYTSQNNSNIDFIINNINGKNYSENIKRMANNPKSILNKLKREELFKWVDDGLLDEYFKLAEESYHNLEKGLKSYIIRLENLYRKDLNKDSKTDLHISPFDRTRDVYDLYRRALNYLYNILKIISAPSQVLSYYVQLLDYICNKFSSKEYLIDPNPPKYKHLYHLSDNPELTKFNKTTNILIPLKPETGFKQVLPPRIPFSETVIGCCYGTPKYFYGDRIDPMGLKMSTSITYDFDKDKSRDLYLYEGIQTPQTQFIKPAIILSSVGEANYSKEICVVSDIEIKKIGKVKVYYDPSLPTWHPRKFAEVEIIEEY